MEHPDLFGICPYTTIQHMFAGKWVILIFHYLRDGKLRFGQLQRQLTGISQATLTKQLRQLEKYGLIERYAYAEIPPKVEYTLSTLGREFLPVLDQFAIFGNKYITHMAEQT